MQKEKPFPLGRGGAQAQLPAPAGLAKLDHACPRPARHSRTIVAGAAIGDDDFANRRTIDGPERAKAGRQIGGAPKAGEDHGKRHGPVLAEPTAPETP